MLKKTNFKSKIICCGLTAIILAPVLSFIPTAGADSIGKKMGKSAKIISNGATSVYQSTETAVRISAETIAEQTDSLHQSANEWVEDIGQSYHNFIYDFQQGYSE